MADSSDRIYSEKDIKVFRLNNLHEHLQYIQERPLFSVHVKSITALVHYLKGYLVHFIRGEHEHNPYLSFIQLEAWIADKHKTQWEACMGKLDFMYLSLSGGNEEQAFNKFFEDWDEYKKVKNISVVGWTPLKTED